MQAASEHLGLYGGQWWLQSMDIWSAPEVHEKFPEVALGCEFAAIMSSGKIIFKIGLIVLDAFSLHFLVLQSPRPPISSSSSSVHNNYVSTFFSSNFDTCVLKWLVPNKAKGKSTKGTRLQRKSVPTLTRPSMGALELCHPRRKEGKVLQSLKFRPSKFNQMLEPLATSSSENYHLPLTQRSS